MKQKLLFFVSREQIKPGEFLANEQKGVGSHYYFFLHKVSFTLKKLNEAIFFFHQALEYLKKAEAA